MEGFGFTDSPCRRRDTPTDILSRRTLLRYSNLCRNVFGFVIPSDETRVESQGITRPASPWRRSDGQGPDQTGCREPDKFTKILLWICWTNSLIFYIRHSPFFTQSVNKLTVTEIDARCLDIKKNLHLVTIFVYK